MPLRLYHLPGMHVGKFLGNVVQRYNLAVPGLRGAEWFRESIGVVSSMEQDRVYG
jgi:hypothetical protein